MDEFRINLHHELVLIDKLENEKVTLMQNIKRLEDVNKMQENGIEMEWWYLFINNVSYL